MTRSLSTLVTLCCFLVALAPAGARAEPIRAFVSVAPQKFLVERIGGDAVEVTALVGPGQDPHHFSLTPRQALELAKARVFFATGMPFEKSQLGRIRQSNPELRVIDLTADMILMEMPEHDHGDDHDHGAHGEYDPHVWLSPPLLKQQAKTIRDTLAGLAPDAATREALHANTDALLAEIDATHTAIAETLAPYEGENFYVFHPAFAYFADTYGLRQISVELAGKKPTAQRIVDLIHQASDDGVHTLFVQPGFDHTAAQQIAKGIGGKVAELDPLAPGVLANLRAIAKALAEGFADQP